VLRAALSECVERFRCQCSPSQRQLARRIFLEGSAPVAAPFLVTHSELFGARRRPLKAFPDGNAEHVTRKVTSRQQFLCRLLFLLRKKPHFGSFPLLGGVPGTLSEASKRLLRRPSVPALNAPDHMPLPACNRDCSSFEPHVEADTPLGNCHTCDIHSATSAFSLSKRKKPSKGPELISSVELHLRGLCPPNRDESRVASLAPPLIEEHDSTPPNRRPPP
jgi:hypothetical protein